LRRGRAVLRVRGAARSSVVFGVLVDLRVAGM